MTVGIDIVGLVGTVAGLAAMSVQLVDKMRSGRTLSEENKARCAELARQLEGLARYVEGMQSAQPEELHALGPVWAGALKQLAVDMAEVKNKLRDLASPRRHTNARIKRLSEIKNAGDVKEALQFAEGKLATAWSRLQSLDSRKRMEKSQDSVLAGIAGLNDLVRNVSQDQSRLRAVIEQVLGVKDKALSMHTVVDILETARVPAPAFAEEARAGPAAEKLASGDQEQGRTGAVENLPGVSFDYESERKRLQELHPQLLRFWRRLERGKSGKRMSEEERSDLAALTRLLWMPWKLDRNAVQRSADYGVLGTGAFGVVFKGTLKLKTCNVSVAIKIMQSAFSEDEFKADFFREASMLHRLRHPAIVTFYGAWWPEDTGGDSTSGSDDYEQDTGWEDDHGESRDEETAAFVMEKMDGHIGDLVENGKIGERQDLWSIFFDSAEGLYYLHEQGVAHMDVKPENILARVAGGPNESRLLGRAKLADFGVSRQRKKSAASRSTRESQRSKYGTKTGVGVVGTLAFMAPEILMRSDLGLGESTVDAGAVPNAPVPAEGASNGARLFFASDVYSLGMTICRVMQISIARAGKRVELPSSFRGGEGELATAARSGALAGDVNRWVNEVLREEVELRELVLSCVQPRPSDRPSMASVLVALQESGSVSARSSNRGAESRERLHEMSSASTLALGIAYRDGKGVDRDLQRAFSLILRSSDQGNVDALEALGSLYASGDGVAKDTAKAFEVYQRAVDRGNVNATYLLGVMYQYGNGVVKDSARAFELYKQAAERGNIDATSFLGFLYQLGDGVAKDSYKACELYQRAADGGNMFATNNLGFMYANGEGVPKNSVKACKLYQRAADGGHMLATNNLGRMYENGDGVTKDSAKACELYQRAADGGDMVATNNLGRMYKSGCGVAKDSAKACELYHRAAKGNNMDAVFNLGYMYENGDGVAKDSATARELYQRAADCGHLQATHNLGFMHERGEGVPKDSSEAFKLYQRAADGGHLLATYKLGRLYENGDGGVKDTTKACELYQRAADGGHSEAASRLGKLRVSVDSRDGTRPLLRRGILRRGSGSNL